MNKEEYIVIIKKGRDIDDTQNRAIQLGFVVVNKFNTLLISSGTEGARKRLIEFRDVESIERVNL